MMLPRPLQGPALCALAVALVGLAGAPLGAADPFSFYDFDGTIQDSVGVNDGTFYQDQLPTYVEGYDSTPGGAIQFDGVDDLVELPHLGGEGLPLQSNPALSVTMWVRGDFSVDNDDDRVFSESRSDTSAGNPLYNIGTDNDEAGGYVDIYIRNPDGSVPVNHRKSQGIAFDNTWHHIAWVDDNGAAVLYIDGELDPTNFTYTKVDMENTVTTVGGILRGGLCCMFTGEIDDVRLFDVALTAEEVQEIFLSGQECPVDGDTTCGQLLVTPPIDDGPGEYIVTAVDSIDDSGDDILYSFKAESESGQIIESGRLTENSFIFDLTEGEWTLSVTVDDDPVCPDEVPGGTTCSTTVIVACPVSGDTRCGGVTAESLNSFEPGLVTAFAANATDDTGDEIYYTFTADNGVDPPITVGPQLSVNFADFDLGEGTWTISVTVDDSLDCDDTLAEATCETTVTLSCPADGDTTIDDVFVDGPGDELPGTYTITALDAADASGDLFYYVFTADNGVDPPLTIGGPNFFDNFADFTLSAGTWTLSVTVDDNPLCDDEAPGGSQSVVVEVLDPDDALVSHWDLDGSFEDLQPSANDGVFLGLDGPDFVDGFDGTFEGAVQFDGIEDIVDVQQLTNLPITANRSFTVALWVKGPPPTDDTRDRRVFAEAYNLPTRVNPLFNIGTHNGANTGEVDIYIRNDFGQVAHGNHLHSDRIAFDDTWHHIAWADDNGDAILYIDGIRDATDFRYTRTQLTANTTTIGGILRDVSGYWFPGAIDDVKVWNYALSQAEVEALIPTDGCPASGDTTCETLEYVGPEDDAPGAYQFTATGSDTSGDTNLWFTFVATSDEGERVQVGPQQSGTASLFLRPGEWTITATADDDLACFDRDPAIDTLELDLTVAIPDPRLVSHWTFDGDTLDQIGDNDGVFVGEPAPPFVEGYDGTPDSALTFDGVDDYVDILTVEDLPITENFAFTIAMWVRGDGTVDNVDDRVFSESNTTGDNSPLFNIGTDNNGANAFVDQFIRNDTGQGTPAGHRQGQLPAFDGTWHHIAYTEEFGQVTLYVDGVPDPANFDYNRDPALLTVDKTTIGGILRATGTCCLFTGDIDDVRLYNYALEECEVVEIVTGQPACDGGGPIFKRGDVDGNGILEITDVVNDLAFQFLGQYTPVCLDAHDFDDNGLNEITDAVNSLGHQFLGDPPPPAPGTATCGVDPTDDGLDCANYPTASGCQ